MNAQDQGYPRVIVNLVLVALVFFTLAFGAHALDRRGWRRRRTLAAHR